MSNSVVGRRTRIGGMTTYCCSLTEANYNPTSACTLVIMILHRAYATQELITMSHHI